MSRGSIRVLLEVAASDLAMAAMVSDRDAGRSLKLVASAVEALGGTAVLLKEKLDKEHDGTIYLPNGVDICSPEQYVQMKELVDRYANLHPALRGQSEEEDETEDRSTSDQTDREDSESEGETGTGEEESQ